MHTTCMEHKFQIKLGFTNAIHLVYLVLCVRECCIYIEGYISIQSKLVELLRIILKDAFIIKLLDEFTLLPEQ